MSKVSYRYERGERVEVNRGALFGLDDWVVRYVSNQGMLLDGEGRRVPVYWLEQMGWMVYGEGELRKVGA